jgi:hypothetical protein
MNKIILSLFFILFSNLTYSQFWLDSLDLSPIYAPNSITCDNDNVNDAWRAESDVEWDNYDVKIFNSWGQCIWVSNDIKEWWYGEKIQVGTHYSLDGLYIYKISARKEYSTFERSGIIYMIR